MAAEVEIEFEQVGPKGRFVVPPFSVGSDHKGKFVFVVKPSETGFGIVERKTVTIGELTTEGLEIIEGLKDGELLVTAGVSRIRDKQTVKMPPLKE